MSKQITSVELAEMLAQVILRIDGTPLAGEDKDGDYNDFMHKISDALAFYCGYGFGGGDFEPGYIDPVTEEESEEYFVSFNPNSSEQANDPSDLMAPYDVEGWEEHQSIKNKGGEAISIRAKRTGAVLSKIISRMESGVIINTKIKPWDKESLVGDKATEVVISKENIYLTQQDEQGEEDFSLCLETDKNVTAVHIMGDGQDCTLHIHKKDGNLLITPDEDENPMEMTKKGEGVYQNSQSMKIKIN